MGKYRVEFHGRAPIVVEAKTADEAKAKAQKQADRDAPEESYPSHPERQVSGVYEVPEPPAPARASEPTKPE